MGSVLNSVDRRLVFFFADLTVGGVSSTGDVVQAADELGLDFTDLVESVLGRHLNLDREFGYEPADYHRDFTPADCMLVADDLGWNQGLEERRNELQRNLTQACGRYLKRMTLGSAMDVRKAEQALAEFMDGGE